MPGLPALAVLAALVAAASFARADDAEALRAENARLRARVERLERENARLRRIGPDPARLDEAAVAERVTVTRRADGTTRTAAAVPLTVTAGSRADHALELAAEGDTVRATVQSWFSGGIHAHVRAVEFDADGAAVRAPVVAYDVTPIAAGSPHRRRRRDHERLTVALDRAALATLGAAHSVGGRVGRVRFLIEPRDQATLRAFALRVSPPAPTATPPPGPASAR